MKFYDQTNAHIPEHITEKKAHIVGGGIAGLAAAVYLIQDAHMPGANIAVYESRPNYGGALEAFGSPEEGYISPGAREPEPFFECLWELCSRIPSLEDPNRTILDETVEFNQKYPIFCSTRFLEKQGQRRDDTNMQMNPACGKQFAKLLFAKDEKLENIALHDWFDEEYFNSTMWHNFRTKLAFQTWDSPLEMKMYVYRFSHLGEGGEEHRGIKHFKYNEYDSLVKPIIVYLEQQGVTFRTGTEVTDFDLMDRDGKTIVTAIHTMQDGQAQVVSLTQQDYVFFTSGSMVQGSTYGTNTTVAEINRNQEHKGCFALWEKLAAYDPKFGHPKKFDSNVDKTLWMSFSLTMQDCPKLVDAIERITGDKDGCAGVVTIDDSPWLLSTYVQHQPFFPGQPDDVQFVWNYGLLPWNQGDYIKKPMYECTGEEILREFLYQLGLTDDMEEIVSHCKVRACMMPYITSQFMPREKGDRPNVIPEGCANLALMGQFVETEDVVFTVETSVRTAMMAVYGLLGLDKKVIPIAPTKYDIRVIASMFRMITGNGKSIPPLPPMDQAKLVGMLNKIPAFLEDI